MSFDTPPDGTFGAKQPGGRLLSWFNNWNMNRVRRKGFATAMSGGRVVKMDALVLTTVGRKSGAPRSTPLAWFPDGADGWLIVASANGAPRHPAWYHNLAAHPDRVTIEIAGRTIPVRAEELHDRDRETAWHQIVSRSSAFAAYAEQTDRQLPVIRLTARPTATR
jgi:deazaflavin-dependent oxidoreductase (nitroreductase family)